MRFELERVTAQFGVFNPREEKNKGPACDLPFEVTVGAEVLSMLLPAQEEDPTEGVDNAVALSTEDRLVAELYSAEGYVKRPAISPIHINRKPEGVTVTIWDMEDPEDEPLVLKPCRFTTLQAELIAPHQIVLKGKLQYSLYTDAELIRINGMMNRKCDIAWVVDQSDMFEGGGEADGEESAGSEPEEEGQQSEEQSG
jgi:hypothetical protein